MRLIEKVNVEILKEIVKKINSVPTSDGKNTLGNTKDKYQEKCKKALKHYLSLVNENGEAKISYEQNKKLETRFVCKNGVGLQLIPRKVRGHIAGEFYVDIDVKGCHHQIIKNLLLRMGEKIPPSLNDYLKDKKVFEKKYGLTKDDMIKFINKEELNKGKKFQTLKELHTLIYKDLLFYLKNNEKSFFKKVDKYLANQNVDYNKAGKSISHYLQHEENKILQTMYGYITSNTDINVGVLCYDGMMLEKNENIDDDLLRKIEDAVKKYTKYDIQLVIKEFDYSWDYKNAPVDEVNLDDEEEGCISDELAYGLFKDLYKDKIITDEGFDLYLNNEYGIWEKESKNGKILQRMIFDFGRYLKQKGMIYNLKNESARGNFKSGIITFLQNKYLKFNENPFLLPFRNGVVDLKTGEFRKAKPEEYIIDYIDYDYKKTTTKKIEHFLAQLFDKVELGIFVLNVLTMSLEGVNRFQSIVFFIGVLACNGKSTLLELMSKAMGYFGTRLSTNLITSSREKAEGANEALMVLKNRRFAYCSEPETGKKININTVKEITGDVITTRANHGKQDSFKVVASLFLLAQFSPELDNVDAGILRRVDIVPFNNVFVDNPTKPNERQKKNFTIEEFDELKLELMNLLICNYQRLQAIDFKFEKPQIVQDHTADYFNDNDRLTEFLTENFEFKEGCGVKITDIETMIKAEKINANNSVIKSTIKKIFNVDYYKDTHIDNVKYKKVFRNLVCIN